MTTSISVPASSSGSSRRFGMPLLNLTHLPPPLRNARLARLRFHDLRHSAATLLLSRGTHPEYVRQLLGHRSIKLTLDRYSHWMPSMATVVADEMDAALG